jgi:phosphoadenosine phosphosulfate reductase
MSTKKRISREEIAKYQEMLEGKTAEDIIRWAVDFFGPSRLALASSLSAEDQIITDILVSITPEAKVFTLDTGRLFQETYDVLERTRLKYKINIEVCFPDTAAVEEMVNEKGPNLFYYSVENRKQCCNIRKVRPLKKKLSSLDGWICGLRREQSVTRSDLQAIEWDNNNGLLKINPLIHWNEQQVWDYIKKYDVPYNFLHDRGFPSIGCAPCTRAVKPGEDIRSGRWWWELPEYKECGLHK